MTTEDPTAVIYPEGWTAASLSKRWITVLALRNRFTKAEKIRLEMAAIDDPTAVIETRQQSAGLRANMKDLDAARYVDLDRSDTRSEVQGLETAGLLDYAGRALEILDAEIQPHERYDPRN